MESLRAPGLMETAESVDLIIQERAKIPKDNAEGKLAKMSKDDLEFEIIRAALTRAITRLNVAGNA